jgi:hypothetical protein
MSIAQYSDDELYYAWVAAGRNSTKAAAQLGMGNRAFQQHVTRKSFEARYNLEFTQVAENTRKMVFTDMLLNLPKVMQELMKIIVGPDPEDGPNMVKVRAIETYLKYLPLPTSSERDEQPFVIEIKNNDSGQSGPASAEDQVRGMIEANIHKVMDKKR